jgi:[ribosomal protein S18]-alanine N-acetyltransferase
MMEVRRPAEHEIVELAQLDYEIFGDHCYPLLSLRQFYDLAGPLLAIAAEDSKLSGYALILPSFVGSEGWFMALGVRADCRRTGIGEVLASRVISEANELGIMTLRLTVEPANHEAIALYRKLGFEPESLITNYFGRGEDRQLMSRQVSDRVG